MYNNIHYDIMRFRKKAHPSVKGFCTLTFGHVTSLEATEISGLVPHQLSIGAFPLAPLGSAPLYSLSTWSL